ncbi:MULTISPECIES: hypothetical protein [unclassified Moorena]|uniref:hypothetical protein n=1 Tax=unclassified Moorena TaxID=2683338 RepID=UPI00140144DB|nr:MULTISPECIES: hypothetical protein [unclassified Moorena]NEO17466.1 hypothetical protein [Moorena sp. SIO3E8]NEQ04016.1 hypothetical protein [Moorena sp. SIO3F7]
MSIGIMMASVLTYHLRLADGDKSRICLRWLKQLGIKNLGWLVGIGDQTSLEVVWDLPSQCPPYRLPKMRLTVGAASGKARACHAWPTASASALERLTLRAASGKARACHAGRVRTCLLPLAFCLLPFAFSCNTGVNNRDPNALIVIS